MKVFFFVDGEDKDTTNTSKQQQQLLDRSGRGIKTEPLVTVGQLREYLWHMVAKQWYDYERQTFDFVKIVGFLAFLVDIDNLRSVDLYFYKHDIVYMLFSAARRPRRAVLFARL